MIMRECLPGKKYALDATLAIYKHLVQIMERLSEHDRAVLDVMFDPLQLMESSISSTDTPDDSVDLENVKLSSEIADIVVRAIEASKNGHFMESIGLFDEARRKAPKSAAVLNDRAQALRLVGRDDDALKDLNLAVELCKGRGKPGIQALCQRGVLHRCAGRTDDARRDFELAAKGGSSFARNQLVNLNPYAAMCNAMLRDMSEKSWHPQ